MTNKKTTTDRDILKGLDDVLAFNSSIAYIDGDAPELLIRGYTMESIASNLSYEELAFLLLNDRLGTDDETSGFRHQMSELREIPENVLDFLVDAPDSANPMASLRTAVSMIGVMDPNSENFRSEDLMRSALRLIALMPTIVSTQLRISNRQKPIKPDQNLDHASNYYYMLTGKPPDVITRQTLNTLLVLYAEHETNASTFAARVVVGTQSDFYSAVVAGIGAIKGPLHGGAIEGAMKMFIDIGTPNRAANYVDDALAAKRRLPGFGHRVYRAGDPRAASLRNIAQKFGESVGNTEWFDIATACEQRMQETKKIIPNVDYFAAIVLHQLGIPIKLMTNVVASSRIAGWSAHILEQYSDNRLIRPRSLYTGSRDLKFPKRPKK